ncbi:MAG: hypothetical protein RLZZ502_733, partial [Pseudomonadota bacterium]
MYRRAVWEDVQNRLAIIFSYHHDMKLMNLKVLVAVIEHGSLRNAARQLGLSQPAVTKSVRDLERELTCSLFVRSSRGMIATAQGRVVYQHAKLAMRELDTAVSEVRQLAGVMEGHISVAAVPLAVMLLIPETLRTFSKDYPRVNLRIGEELYMAQLNRLRQGEVDIAIGGIPEGLPLGEFITEPILETIMVPVVRKGSALAQ